MHVGKYKNEFFVYQSQSLIQCFRDPVGNHGFPSPHTSCLALCTPYRSLNVKRPTCVLPMGFLTFDHDVLVFMGQIRDPLRNRLESAIQRTGKPANQNRSYFVTCEVL